MKIEEIKYLRRLEYALKKSYKKLEDEVKNLNSDDDIFTSVAEVIMWINIVNQWHWDRKSESNYDKVRENDQHGLLIEPIRFCFNELKHNTKLIDIQRVECLSARFGRMRYGTALFGASRVRVIWAGDGLRPDEQLKNSDKKLKEKYNLLLKGKDVLQTLGNAINFLIREGRKYQL